VSAGLSVARTPPAKPLDRVPSGGEGARMATASYIAIIEKEGDLYAALSPKLDIAS